MTLNPRFLAIAALSLSAVAAGAWLALDRRGDATVSTSATVYPAARPLPDFELVDDRGQALRPGDLRGHWSWLFFGFTHCPDVCPASLTVLADAVRRFDAPDTPHVYLISVDPERDTPATLAGYVDYFHPDFTGVTGTPEAIEAVTRQMYVAHAKVPQGDDGYTIDHTSAIYFVNPRGDIVAVSTTPHTPQALAADMRTLQRRYRE